MKETVKKEDKPFRGKLLTVTEAVEYSGIKRTSFYALLNKGYIRYFKTPIGKILIDSADIDDMFRKSEIPASAFSGGF